MKKHLIIIVLMSAVLSACSTNSGNREAAYEGEDITGFATINRDKQTKEATITINQPGEWKLYAGPSVDEIDLSTPLLFGREAGNFHLNVPDSVRSYFLLETQRGKAILAERHLPMAGGYNFRDLGGMRTTDGRYVKWGKIFRSDDLHSLTDADLNYLSSIPIKNVVDFRSEGEIQAAPDKVPAATVRDYAYSITPGNMNNATDLTAFGNMNMDSVMMQINVLLVSDEASVGRFKDFFTLLQDESKIPLLFHCSAGKDRTGMAAALILSALGVDEERIMQDYLLSNQYIGEKYAPFVAQYPQLQSLFEVKPEFIRAGFEKIRQDNGTVENFLRDRLAVDIDKFRSMYLY